MTVRFLVAAVLFWSGLTGVASANDVTVDRFDDPVGAGLCTSAPNDCSLRQAIAFAGWGDTLQLGEGTYAPEQGTLMVDKNLTFAGTNRLTSIIDGGLNQQRRTMRILGVTVAFTDLSFTGGSGSDATNPPLNATGGGALFSDNPIGSMIIRRVRFYGNSFVPNGGAIYNNGSLTLQDVDFDSNNATFGGALFTTGNGTVSMDRVSMHGAGGTQGGGMFLNGSTVTMTNSTVADNGQASNRAGGIVNHAGNLTLRNVTLVGNLRGGLETDGTATTTAQNSIFGASPYQDGEASACVAPGLSSAAGGTSAQPISDSLGNNIGEDTICNLDDPSDHPAVAAHLAPATDNGPYAWTAALLHGSPAIDGGAAAACSPLDGRMHTRQGTCDIGAFEAELIAAPTIQSTSSHEVTSSHATLSSEFNVGGESGALTFFWGEGPTVQPNPIVLPTGPGTNLVKSAELDGLDPGKTYYFHAVVENATGAVTGPTMSFTTGAAAEPPAVTAISVDAVTDTTAALRFRIDPKGNETTYVITYNGQTTQAVTIPGNAGDQEYTRSLTGLAPGMQYTVQVVATSDEGTSSPDGATVNLETVPRVSGNPGDRLTIVDVGTNGQDTCPTNVHVDWGDGTPAQDFDTESMTCEDLGGDVVRYTTKVNHVFAAPGHYHVTFAYDRGVEPGESYAQVADVAPPQETPTATATATATPPPVVVAQTPVPTATPTPVPTPVFHSSVIAVPTGTVLIKVNGKYVPLKPGVVPLGSQIDATKGRVTITSVPRAGAPAETAVFYDGIFTVRQVGGITDLVLSGPEPTCKASASAGKKVKSRKLWGEGKGAFRTSGKYSAATVRGTKWLVEDSCAGTKTTVAVGVVDVRDNVAHKTITLRAKKSYLAKPKQKRR